MNNNLCKSSLSSLIYNNNNNVINYELNNNLCISSLSSTINYNYNTLTNRITITNNLLQTNFTTDEEIAFSSVAANFFNIFGSLYEAYMILNLRSRVTMIETTYLTSSFLRNPIYELPILQNNTLQWVNTKKCQRRI